MENLNFLKQKYNLHASPEVQSAAKRAEVRNGEKVPQDPVKQIENYFNRLHEIIDHSEGGDREKGLNAFKGLLYNKYVIKPQDVPEAYFDTQKRLAKELGHGDVEVSEEQREQLIKVIISDQESTMDNWLDYLSSKDATYPDWLKYYAFRSMLSLGEYNKETKQFTKRSKGMTKPFPDLNREALAYVLDALEKKYQPQTKEQNKIEQEDKGLAGGRLTDEEKEARQKDKAKFAEILQGENFAKLYAWAIDKVTPASKERLINAEGKWIKYNQGTDHTPLVASLQGHGTGWCTAGESTAKVQLSVGDFYVYYSLDENGQATVPRAAIRMEGNSIGEVRGIGPDQNLDPYIGDVVKAKMVEFSDGKDYEKKSSDMKRLTEIDNKVKKDETLSKDELIFLYEIKAPIDGFGFQRDPRIKEIIATRNIRVDAPVALDCEPGQIAYNCEMLNENTKAYIGPLFPKIFSYSFEHIYTSFPEGKIERFSMTIGGKSQEEIKEDLKKKEESDNSEEKIYISNNARIMMNKSEFFVLKKPELIKLVRLKVSDLGLPQNVTTKEIYAKAAEFGLELCPPEVGPRLRLYYKQVFNQEQSKNDWFSVGMEPITDADDFLSVFFVDRDSNGKRWLLNDWAKPGNRWNLEHELVFCIRKA